MRILKLVLPFSVLAACGPQMPSVGQSWSVDTSSANWVSPDGADALAEVFSSMYPFFFGLHALEGDQASFLMVIGEDGGQDFCSRTVQMNDVTINADLSFSFGPEDFVVANGFKTESLTFAGQISEDFSTVSDMSFEGNLNLGTGPEDLFAMEGSDLTACEMVELFEMSCGPCADGSDMCLLATVTDAVATGTPGLSLVEIDAPDCHAQCEISAENDDCDL